MSHAAKFHNPTRSDVSEKVTQTLEVMLTKLMKEKEDDLKSEKNEPRSVDAPATRTERAE